MQPEHFYRTAKGRRVSALGPAPRHSAFVGTAPKPACSVQHYYGVITSALAMRVDGNSGPRARFQLGIQQDNGRMESDAVAFASRAEAGHTVD